MSDSRANWLRRAAEEIAKAGHYGWGNTCADAAEHIDALEAELAALRADRDELRFERDKAEADYFLMRERAEKAEAEAAGLRADAERWRAVSAMMTHEHRGDAVGWTLSVLLPGDDPDAAVDAVCAGGKQ